MSSLTHNLAYWEAQNLVLNNRGAGYVYDTGAIKIGDGVHGWNALVYKEQSEAYSVVSGTDTYVVTSAMPTILGYYDGMKLRVKFTNANTGASTINLNGLGAKAIKKEVSTALASGDILAGSVHELYYDGTNFQVSNGVSSSAGTPTLSQVLTAGNDATNKSIINLDKISVTKTTFISKITWDLVEAKYVVTESYNSANNDYAAIQTSIVSLTNPTVQLYLNDNLLNITSLTASKQQIVISGSKSDFYGATYNADYSANYTSRSLIDKGYAAATFAPISVAGSVTSVAWTTSQGVSASIANATTTPNITITLGALTGVTSFNGLVVTANTGAITTGTWSATAIAANKGGTGQTVYAVGDLLYASTTSALSKLADVAVGSYLRSGGVNTAPLWSTLKLPNAATTGRVFYSTATDTLDSSASLLYDGAGNFEANNTINSAIYSGIRNNSTGTAGISAFYAINSITSMEVSMLSTGFTTSGANIANYGLLRARSGADGMNIVAAKSSGTINFYTGGEASGNQRVVISSAGNFYIGYNAASVNGERWGVKSTANEDASFQSYCSNTGTAAIGGFRMKSDASDASWLTFGSGYTDVGLLRKNSTLCYANASDGFAIGSSHASGKLIFFVGGTATTDEKARISAAGNVSIGGTATRGTTVGTFALQIFNGTAPVGTLTNGCSFYSTAGEMRVMDAAGNATLLSPHEKETNYWIYDSVDTTTGKRLKIDMEQFMKFLNKKMGTNFVHEFMNENN